MFKAQKSNLGKSVETFESIVGATLRVEGDLVISKSLRIDGAVTGDIYQGEGSKATVAIAPGATVLGNISVQDVIVSGTLKGNIVSSGRVEFIETAVVEGDVTYGSIGIAVGARIVGQLKQIDASAHNDAASAIRKAAKQPAVE
jgi:cytoskeletal protein CcmA (bactofilin family)